MHVKIRPRPAPNTYSILAHRPYYIAPPITIAAYAMAIAVYREGRGLINRPRAFYRALAIGGSRIL